MSPLRQPAPGGGRGRRQAHDEHPRTDRRGVRRCAQRRAGDARHRRRAVEQEQLGSPRSRRQGRRKRGRGKRRHYHRVDLLRALAKWPSGFRRPHGAGIAHRTKNVA
ncbi:MAG: hypothetical protein BJ554DRAFT_7671 [Olpidium bornovanus]|uniref:Uncharacterized protein n=1 Tax=Olpidium bornovanus TaxID=278681 RepID=A0A8H8DJ98_9FUNG|nr:MAG: hypothetical protein BJ554DRAFT_7671 [Olpidium bornovanus]